MRSNFRRPKRKQHLRLGRRDRLPICRYFSYAVSASGKIFQLRFRISEIKPEIRFHVAEVSLLPENAEDISPPPR